MGGGEILRIFRMPKRGPRGKVREYQAKREALPPPVCSLLGSSMKERCEVTVLRVDHQNSVQKESATFEFDARRWKHNLSSLMVKGGDLGRGQLGLMLAPYNKEV